MPTRVQAHHRSSMEETSEPIKFNDEVKETDLHECYTIQWTSGKLGLVFTPAGDGAIVIRQILHPARNTKNLDIHHATIGDRLVALNDLPLYPSDSIHHLEHEDDYDSVIRRIKSSTLPLRLTFEKPETNTRYRLRRGVSSSSSCATTDSSEDNRESDVLLEQDSNVGVNAMLESRASDEYEVQWTVSETLGLTLQNQENVPVVEKLHQEFHDHPGRDQVALGDILVTIDRVVVTSKVGFEASMKRMLAAVRNSTANEGQVIMTLRFMRHSKKPNPKTVQNVAVQWTRGPLGLELDDMYVIRAFTRREIAGGSAAAQDLREGDALVTIANVPVTEFGGHRALLAILDRIDKPIVLVFRTMRNREYRSSMSSHSSYDSSLSELDDLSTFEFRESSIISFGDEGASEYSEDSDSESDDEMDFPQEHEPEEKISQLDVEWTSGSLGLVLHASALDEPVICENAGRGKAKELKEGDILVMINHQYVTREIGFSTTIELLKKLPKPVVLTFLVKTVE